MILILPHIFKTKWQRFENSNSAKRSMGFLALYLYGETNTEHAPRSDDIFFRVSTGVTIVVLRKTLSKIKKN